MICIPWGGAHHRGTVRFIQAIELDPKYVKAWAKKGDIEFFMKEYHRAMESYKKGLVRTYYVHACVHT